MNAKTLAAILVTVPDAEVVIVSYRHPGSMAPAVVTYDINYVCIEELETWDKALGSNAPRTVRSDDET